MTLKSILLPAVILVAGVSTSCRTSSADKPSAMRVVADENGCQIFEGNTLILFYQASPRSLDGNFKRAGYVHPLYGLDGQVLTEDFPADHRHHRGIFWAWHQLFVGETRIGDPWICRDFLSRVDHVEVLKDEPDSVAIRATLNWVSPDWTDTSGRMKPIIREETSIRAFRSEASHRVIDFRIQLLALEPDVRLGGSEDVKGYGGFSPRFRLPEDVRFLADYGEVQPQKTAVDRSPWMDITGSFADSGDNGLNDPSRTPARPTEISGITVLCHPSVPGFPQKWILRQARSMQNPVFPGREATAVSMTEPLELRYRMIIHRGEASMDQLSAWFTAFAAKK